ncbi:MAG: alpha/beta hydrolase [Planctomycetes bacterium]|nr:alpha/beta hydrolase [Planctomycetota bacterium]
MPGGPASGKKKASAIRKPLLRLALFLLLVCFVLTTEACHNRLLLFPRKAIRKTPAVLNVAFENVTFANARGKQLAGWYCPAKEPIGAIVLNHGNAGNIDLYIDYAHHFTRGGISVLLYDYQGFGNSEGSRSLSQLVGDGLAAFDYLASRTADPDKIAVMGVSLGTPVSCAVARQRPSAKALILEGAFLPETELYWRMGILGTPVAFIIAKTLPFIDPEQDIKALDGRPLLMIHGDKDRVTPLFGAGKLYEKAQPPKWLWVMEGVGHFSEPMLYKQGSYPKAVVEFLRHAFLDEPFDQPRIDKWTSTKLGGGKWRVSADIHAPRGHASLVVTTAANTAVRKKKLPAGSSNVTLEVEGRPITVSAFVEPQPHARESNPR